MAKAIHSTTFPGSGDSFSITNFNNAFNALHQGDFAPLRPRAHSVPDMGIMIGGSLIENYFTPCYASGDYPMASLSGDVTFTIPPTNSRIDLVYASGDKYYKQLGTQAASPTYPVLPSGDKVLPIAYVYHKTTETKIVNYEDKDANPDDGYIIRDIRPLFTNPRQSTDGSRITNLQNTPASAGALPVTNGGTGVATLTGVVKGNGSSPFSVATAGTDYIVVGAAMSAGDLFTTAWVDYTSSSTVLGWSSFNVKYIYYKKVGRLVFVSFYLDGTSNSTIASFTLPATSANFTYSRWGSLLLITQDNGTTLDAPGRAYLESNSATVNLYKSGSVSLWGSGNSKTAVGSFWYEAAS